MFLNMNSIFISYLAFGKKFHFELKGTSICFLSPKQIISFRCNKNYDVKVDKID